jgi:hypothetical protein
MGGPPMHPIIVTLVTFFNLKDLKALFGLDFLRMTEM